MRSRAPAGARERLVALGRIRHPNLAVVSVAPSRGGVVRYTAAPVAGFDLGTVCAARPRFSAGELVSVLVPLAGALAALHAGGLAHGDVSLRNVVIRPDGRPVLIDLVGGAGASELGTPGFAAPERGGGAAPPGDVYSLAQVGLWLLDREDPQAAEVTARLESALVADPRARPSARELGRRLFLTHAAEPVALPDRATLSSWDVHRRAEELLPTERRHRSHWPVLVGICLVGIAGWWVLRPAPDPPSPVSAAVRLTYQRARALVAGDLAELREVTVPGSPAAHADLRLARSLARGLGPAAVRIARVELLPADATWPQVRVLLVATVVAGGAPADPADLPEPTAVLLVLEPTPAGWRVSRVAEPPATAPPSSGSGGRS